MVVAPQGRGAHRQFEFINLAENRILLIIVTTGGDVQNRLLITRRAYTPTELNGAAALPQQALRQPVLRGDPPPPRRQYAPGAQRHEQN